jgi:hypothetical protein
MLSRFIVKSHSFIKGNLFWKYGVVLEYENTSAIIIEDYIHGKIRIVLEGENKKALLAAIRVFMTEVHMDFDKEGKLIFNEMIPCNCGECINASVPFFFEFKVLKKYEKKEKEYIICQKSVEEVKVHSLISDVSINSNLDNINTNEELKILVLNIMENVLEREIKLRGGFINFWRDEKYSIPKNEVEFQQYISNTLDRYCKTRGINLAREVKEANGNVDILFSYTNQNKQLLKVCVEIKKAHHDNVLFAMNSQLKDYMTSSETDAGIYLVVWLKNKAHLGPKNFKTEKSLREALDKNNSYPKQISVKTIDCSKGPSPSKKKAKKVK